MDIKELPQPLGFFHVITNTDSLHYGYWSEELKDNDSSDLTQGQQQLSQQILQRLPEPPATLLDVGCGLGLMAGELHQLGYQVTAIAPSQSLIDYAKNKYPGPTFVNCGFLDEHPVLQNGQFDVLVFQESLQYFSDLPAVFQKAEKLLSEKGRLILCDEVSYEDSTQQRSAVHPAKVIESSFFNRGFFVQHHETMGEQVTPTCAFVLEGLNQKRQEIIDAFGSQANEQIEQLIVEWQNLKNWYQNKVFGYELWDLRISTYSVRSYQSQDESCLVEQFNQVFQEKRSLEHWRWKFLDNPRGGPCISMAWDGDQLAAHFSAYPLLLSANGKTKKIYHSGDTFTLPTRRGVGRGKTSLLSRVVRLFYRNFCENSVDFIYGFNTGKIQKFGKLFLSYTPIAPVHEYFLAVNQHSLGPSRLASFTSMLKGYDVAVVEECGTWADELSEQAKNDYDMYIIRDKRYLTWRYDHHPDYTYQYTLLKKRGKVVGWWVTRKVGQTLLLIDAFCIRNHSRQMIKGLQELLRIDTSCTQITGWFSSNPEWWHEQLISIGFQQKRHSENLDLCATFFSDKYDQAALANKFYFTMGDSDLY